MKKIVVTILIGSLLTEILGVSASVANDISTPDLLGLLAFLTGVNTFLLCVGMFIHWESKQPY